MKVWWKCSKYGGEYQAKISDRIRYGCYCCNKQKKDSEKYKLWIKQCNMVKEYYMINNYLPIGGKNCLKINNKKFNVYGWVRGQRKRCIEGKLSDE